MGTVCCKEQDIDSTQEPELSHFQLQKIIGKGVFGRVRIVQHKRTKKQYALKYINKSICIKQRSISQIISERHILERIEHPLISNLRYAFQDDETLFMALDLMKGGDLRFHLNQQLYFPEEQVRHYIAATAIALHYLHKKRIVHRDIKPENILLDDKGYAHVTDFNIAIQLNPKQPMMWSMAGTMAYMAPEMVSRKGYTTAVDWWSLGIMAYELLFGMRPFRSLSKEALVHSIIHTPVVFPDNVYELVTEDCIDVITGLLDKSPFHRLGCSNDGLDKFKSHPWFNGINWDRLENKQWKPPVIPTHSGYNHRFEEDGLVTHKRMTPVKSMDGYPVTEEAKYQVQLEEQFLTFDYQHHQMEEQDVTSELLEQRRNSLIKRQWEPYKDI